MSVKHEEYIFFQECITSLNAAWSIVDAIDKDKSHKTVTWAAYRMALIEYAKPYKNSRGIQVKNHTLLLPDFSVENKILHDRIIDLRDTVLAHSDITVKGARLYFGNIEGKPLPLILSSTKVELPLLAEFRQLIELSLDQLYNQLPNFENQLSGEL